MFLFLGQKSLFLIGRLLELKFDWLISYDAYMIDNIEVTRLSFSCEEAVLSEGLVFLLGGLYGNLVTQSYYLFMALL